eukprot:scaffold241956_cov29-Tisochrysis_lutea.AAC.3
MALCATQVASGALTVGDAVAINGLLLQLHSPLTALGYTYQEIRQVRALGIDPSPVPGAALSSTPMWSLHERRVTGRDS